MAVEAAPHRPRIGIFAAAFPLGAPMRFAGSLGKSASDLFAELFPTGTVSLDALQSSLSDASSTPPASSNPEHAEATAQSGPPHPAGLLADDGADGSLPDLVAATAGTAAEASSQHVPASAAFFQDQTTDSDNGFYALSSDAYWSNDEGISHRPAELGADDHDGDLAAPMATASSSRDPESACAELPFVLRKVRGLRHAEILNGAGFTAESRR